MSLRKSYWNVMVRHPFKVRLTIEFYFSTACNWENAERRYKIPIYGILYDGSHFQFFIFDGKTKPFKFSMGAETVAPGRRGTQLPLYNFPFQHTRDARISFIHSLRPICETVFNMFLLAYIEALKTRRSVSSAESVDDWDKAIKITEEALEKSQDAEKLRQNNLIAEADELADAALKGLKLRYFVTDPLQLEFNLSTVQMWYRVTPPYL
jgi:hypothetical protein